VRIGDGDWEDVAETVRIVRIVPIGAKRKSSQGIGRSSPRTLASSADDEADESQLSLRTPRTQESARKLPIENKPSRKTAFWNAARQSKAHASFGPPWRPSCRQIGRSFQVERPAG
jgi:hypothetical protein